MTDDMAVLIGDETIEYDEYGNQIETRKETEVYCQVKSIGRNEFYSAATAGLKPEWTLIISNPIDYNEETLVRFRGELYSVVRTYRTGDAVELTVERRVGNENL